MLGIGEFRKQLSARVEAAHWEREVTVVRHGQRQQPRAALVPYDVGPEPVAIGVDGDVHSYAVSREWFEGALAAIAKAK